MSGSGLPLSPCRRGLLPRSASCAGRRHGAQAAGGSGRAPGGVRTPRITRERERPPLPGKARPGKKTRKTHPKSLRQDPLSDITYKRFYRNLISPQESKSRRDQESCAGAIHITATGIFNMQGQDKHLFLIRPWDTLWLYTQGRDSVGTVCNKSHLVRVKLSPLAGGLGLSSQLHSRTQVDKATTILNIAGFHGRRNNSEEYCIGDAGQYKEFLKRTATDDETWYF
ncbi:uncharacterized protein LOC118004223 isoform X1 [Mirounga leonina]|uniref:uncharacterized protein LOC118004223 isoform X1 n=1 Tax=Mirounga leonina TaxID=9715 RepID=UPI00156C59EF|nr:uncharacterized protein LOC118004223 isoform X1 [Mirounga leonina]